MRAATPLIAIDRKTTEEAQWIQALNTYISSIYGSTSQFKEQIHALHRLRQDARGCADDAVGRDLLYRYYGQLDLLELRIPVHEHGCRVSFEWIDSYTGEMTTQHSLAFEKASVLFNLACVYSHIARVAEDIKVSYASLQAAAGIFLFIVENFLHAPSKDLQQDAGRALSKLMLAQAQEVFLTKQLNDPDGKPLIISKLSKGCSSMYNDASESLQAVWDNKQWGHVSWAKYCLVKSKYYESVAADYYAKNAELKGKHGEALAYLQLALTGLKDAIRSLSGLGDIEGTSSNNSVGEVQTLIKNYAEAVKHQFEVLEKDNDFIYHDTVPNSSTLPPMPSLEAAKPTSINGLYRENENISEIVGKDLFNGIVPVSVHEKASLYSEEKANLIRFVGESVDIADEELTSAFEHLDLPEMLTVIKTQNSTDCAADPVPPQVSKWSSEISNSDNITNKLTKLETLRQEILQIVKESETSLARERTAWYDARTRYGSKWSQTDPEKYVDSFSDELRVIKSSLESSRAADGKINSIYIHSKQELEILSNPNNLRQHFVAVSSSQAGDQSGGGSLLDIDDRNELAVKEEIASVEDILSKLRKLSKERRLAYSEFKDKVHKDDITGLLVLNAKMPNIEKTLFPAELAKFDPYRTRINDTVQRQESLLNTLQASWRKLLSNSLIQEKTSHITSSNRRISEEVQRLETAYLAYRSCREGVDKGIDFYKTLCDRAREAASQISQFVSQRQSDRDVLSRQFANPTLSEDVLRSQLSGLSFRQDASPTPQIPSYGYAPQFSTQEQPPSNNRDFYRTQSPPYLPPKY